MKYYKTVNEFLFFGNDKIKPINTEEFKPIKFMDNSEDVKRLQTNLESLNFKLTRYGIDHKIGYETLGQLKSLFHLVKTNKDLNKLVEGDLEIKNNSVSPEQQSILNQLANSEKVKELIKKHYEELYKKIEGSDLIAQDIIDKNIEDPE